MFDPTASDDDKLRELRSDFEACLSHQEDADEESHRASRFYHNTNNEGQWEAGDLEYLRAEGRPPFTFNLVKPLVDTFVGMVRDQRKTPRPAAVGGEDAFVAGILGAIQDRIYDIAKMETLEAEVLKHGTVCRDWTARLEVEQDPERPLFVKVNPLPVPCYEIHWDPASRRADRSDARYVFWDKWLSKSEFKRTYPDADYDEVSRLAEAESQRTSLEADWSEGVAAINDDRDDMYSSRGSERFYVDGKRNKVRVIHAEYRVPEKVYYLVDPSTGVTERVSKDIADNLEDYQATGMLAGLVSTSAWKDKIHTVQFVGSEILYDGDLDQPYDGFSFVPFTYQLDMETGTAYGMVRNLFDPQSEANKAHSQSLESIIGQSKPGVMAEKTAIENIDQFEQQIRTTGGVAIVADGALAEGRVQQRNPAQFSPAIAQRLENSISLIERVANIHTDMDSPAAQAEAAATVQLRYKKSLLALSDVVEHFEGFQKGVARRVLQTIVRAMPDSQIAEYLGNSSKYALQDGVIYELDQSSGQPKNQATLQQVKTLRYDVTLEVSSDNDTLRLMEMQGLANLVQLGVPVDPVILVEMATASRSARERLRVYAEQQQQAMAQQAQTSARASEAQIAQTLAIEAGKVQESARHNQATEALQALKQQGEQALKLTAIIEKADEAEKAALVRLTQMIEQRQAQRQSIPAQYTVTGGK